MLGITEISGPWAPSFTPPPWKAITEAQWRRFPFTKTRVLSEDNPLKFTGRFNVAASLIGWARAANEGTVLTNKSNIFLITIKIVQFNYR
jgi:hypothetical protein